MAKTKNGILHLTKTERESLEVIKFHSKCDLSFREDGSYNDENGKFDIKDAKKAERGLKVIDFILDITS
jgi:hypothetical protein